MRSLRAVPLAIAVATVVVSAACYAPTAMNVEISSDVACSALPRIALFGGAPYQRLTAADDSTACTTGSTGDAQLGTLTFRPSGYRDGRASVKVVLAVGRKTSDWRAMSWRTRSP